MSGEAQRQLPFTRDQFIATATAQRAELVALTKATGKQTERVIDLTTRLRTLTVIITWLTGAAVFFGAIQASAIVVHFVRWYRGVVMGELRKRDKVRPSVEDR